MTRTVDADYLVVGAGALGMAFTDALVDHADVRVAVVDRRHGAGGHWLDAYPFVRLHQSSAFYGVASTLLGGGRLQQHGPEAGLQERATASEICAYYGKQAERMAISDHVELLLNSEYVGDRTVVSHISGERVTVPERCRVVNAHYLSPAIPASTPPPFEAGDGARILPVGELVRVQEPPSQYVVVGSGKTGTDAVVWLLARGVDPDAICWVRAREPWMLNRAVVQPDPAIFLGMAAEVMRTATEATSTDDWFLRLEDLGIMLRIDRSVTPTMARAPTLATWELDELRTIQNVVRLGHLRVAEPGVLRLDHGDVKVARDALVVHCAAEGLPMRPMVPIWQPGVITLQPVRAGFPCFGAAVTGYVEATRTDDAEKNRVCPPSPYPNTLQDWAVMNVRGARATMSFSAEPDIKQWANGVALNPARVTTEQAGSEAVVRAIGRMQANAGPGLAALAELVAGDPRI